MNSWRASAGRSKESKKAARSEVASSGVAALESERVGLALPEPELVQDRDLEHREVVSERREVLDRGRQEHAARARGGEVAADVRRKVGEVVGGPQLDAPARDRFGVELEDAAALAERRRARVDAPRAGSRKDGGDQLGHRALHFAIVGDGAADRDFAGALNVDAL